MNQTISLEVGGGVFLGIPHEEAQNASVELDGVWRFAFGLAGENVNLTCPESGSSIASVMRSTANCDLLFGTKLASKSGWPDLNRRPHGPKPCALTRLRHTPLNLAYSKLAEWVKQRGLDGTL